MPDSITAQPKERVIIEGVIPEINDGRFAAKSIIGEPVGIEADIFCDSHFELGAELLWRRSTQRKWMRTPMRLLGNDHWLADFQPDKLGRYQYTIHAWIDRFKTWRRDLLLRYDAGVDVTVDLEIGISFIEDALKTAEKVLKTDLSGWKDRLTLEKTIDGRVELFHSERLARTLELFIHKKDITEYKHILEIVVDPEIAGASAWYELFPRSTAADPGKHGTFNDVTKRLPYIKELGFNVLYLPPVHPIGFTHRKGRNNSVECNAGDPGSPWAIGNDEGGHTAIHPELGTIQEFRKLVSEARSKGIEIALDIAFQTSPDHPWVKEHPEWFKHRPDGSIQYAENPPKKYQDIYPLDFESSDWKNLWNELKSVFDYWISQGVKIFRVDNPHTKPFAFWEWCIGEIKKKHPDVIFLSEAFTRPRTMQYLSKIGFSLSYTYFPWRIYKSELEEYFTELNQRPLRDYFRGSHWTNTPDILIEYLQKGGPAAFKIRFLLASTLASNYGIYGPVFELCMNKAVKEGSEEYIDSEKYEIKYWDLDNPLSIRKLIGKVNSIRKANKALLRNYSLAFHHIDNGNLICYSKSTSDMSNVILTVVNLDPKTTQSGWTSLDMGTLGLETDEAYIVHDLLDGESYSWKGNRNFVMLDPEKDPAHILEIKKTESQE